MKNNIRWIFIVIFFAGLTMLVTRNFRDPKPLFGKTVTTTGQIIDITRAYGPRGFIEMQKALIAYQTGGKHYTFQKIIQKYDKQFIGDKVSLEVSIRNPERYKILGIESVYNNKLENVFWAAKPNGYDEIRLTNFIYRFREYGPNGEIQNEQFGSCKMSHDTLAVTLFTHQQQEDADTTKLYMLGLSHYKPTVIIELETNTRYYNANNPRE